MLKVAGKFQVIIDLILIVEGSINMAVSFATAVRLHNVFCVQTFEIVFFCQQKDFLLSRKNMPFSLRTLQFHISNTTNWYKRNVF